MTREGYLVTEEYRDNCIEILTENRMSLKAKAEMTREEIANIFGISR